MEAGNRGSDPRTGPRVLQEKRNVPQLKVTAAAELLRYVAGYVLGPSLRGVERHDADRVFVLPFQHAKDYGLQVGILDARFAPDLTRRPEVVRNDINRVIVLVRHDGGRPARLTHHKLHTNRTRIQAPDIGIVPAMEQAGRLGIIAL